MGINMIKLMFEKTYRVERYGELCSIAVPFPKGRLCNIDDIVILNEGIVYPSQAKATSFWEDGSIRWLFIYFLADLPSNASSIYYLSYEGVIKDKYIGTRTISCIKDGQGYTIDTGALKITFESGRFGGIKEAVAYGVKYYSGNFAVPELTDMSGRSSMLEFSDFNVIEEGPVCVRLQSEAVHSIGKYDYRVRFLVTAWAGSPIIDISYRLFNTSPEELNIKSLTIPYHSIEKAERTCAAVSNYMTSYEIGENGEPVEKLIDGEYLLYEANEHVPEVFYGTLFTDCMSERGGVAATIYQAQQNYPKAVYADENGFIISLVPDSSKGITMPSGTSREQRFMLHFHDAFTSLEEINNKSLIYQMPDKPVLEPDIYKEADVFINVFVDYKLSYVERGLIYKADSHARCFGMMNYGDSPDDTYTSKSLGEGELVWTNNEYDFPHAASLQYARTGIRRFLDYALVAARHLIDVDICHYSNDPFLIGGQWEHSKRHVIDSKIACSHQWVEGLLDYYHFTGDKEGLDAAIGIGENILKLLDTSVFSQKGEINAIETGWALRSLTALYIETYDNKFIDRCDYIVGHFEEWEKDYGYWLSPYTDNTSIRVVFMISIAVGSLMRYYKISKNHGIKDMIIRAVDDMIENCYIRDCEVFMYKELPSLERIGNNALVLEALVIAYELTGKTEYLRYGKETFIMQINDINTKLLGSKKIIGDALIGPGTGTKNFAQSFIPLVTYYKAAVENHIL